MKNKWRGCKNIEVKWNGSQADPDLIYKGCEFNYWDIEDALWSMFLEDIGHKDSESDVPKIENEFDIYVQENAESYLEECMTFGYFSNGSKSWHD